MSKLALAVAVVLVTFDLSSSAAHADFAGEGKVALGAERMFGLVFGSITIDPPGPGEQTINSTNVTLLWNPGTLAGYSTPRLALDYFVTSGLSLGAGVGLISVSMSTTTEAAGVSTETDGPSALGGLIAPRVGYALTISDSFAIWPRAGITFVTVGGDEAGGDETSANLLAVTLEGHLVIGLGREAALLLGPTVDIGVSGSNESTDGTTGVTTSQDISATDIGIHAGLAAAF